MSGTSLYLREQIARIDRLREEADQFRAQQDELMAEQMELDAKRLRRDRWLGIAGLIGGLLTNITLILIALGRV